MDTNSTPSSISVRSYQPSDLPACQALFIEGHRGYGNSTSYVNNALATDMADIEKNYLQVSCGHWWVAVSTDDNRIVGQIAILPMRLGHPLYYSQLTGEERDHICDILRLGVTLDAQRLGVGKELLSTLINFAHENGYRQIHVTTLTHMNKANAFYKKHGFIKGHIDKTPIGGTPENINNENKSVNNKPTSNIFEVDAIIPDEDQRLMKLSPTESKFIYVQHYHLPL
ncbi:unnamed protein product [Adineta steineri]|uniref:N-acetyltransferase domain-containing protein n=1 Tax=Adineta steineri TaxID=433720 RepID=A0A815EXV2_9BILA|nr:unnamed protein product [Adineta steineri]